MADLDKLEELAKAALKSSGEGRWFARSAFRRIAHSIDADFMHAANPATVLELIALARRDGGAEPVAWRSRYRPSGETGPWTLSIKKPDIVRALMADYIVEPLYAHPADPRPDPLEALREAREALDRANRNGILQTATEKVVEDAIAKINAVMGEAG